MFDQTFLLISNRGQVKGKHAAYSHGQFGRRAGALKLTSPQDVDQPELAVKEQKANLHVLPCKDVRVDSLEPV